MHNLDHEFYLLRIYLRDGGFHLTVCEVMNFFTCCSWALIAFDWNKRRGFKLTLCQ